MKDAKYHFLVENTISKVVKWLIRDNEISFEEALLMFNNSETFDKLEDPETGLYIESPYFVYDLLQTEIKRGTIRGLSE